MATLAAVLEPPDNVQPLRAKRAGRSGRAGEPVPLVGDPAGPFRPADQDEQGGSAALTDYEASFSRLYRRAYDVAYKLLGYRSEAEDAAQEALARAYLHWPKIHSYAEPWVVRVASNQAIGTWRKTRRLTHMDGDLDDEVGQHVSATDPELHLELRRALAKLSKRQREVVVLRHLGGFSERETAAVIGCSTGSVKQHATRGLAALRAELGAPGGVDGDADKPRPVVSPYAVPDPREVRDV